MGSSSTTGVRLAINDFSGLTGTSGADGLDDLEEEAASLSPPFAFKYSFVFKASNSLSTKGLVSVENRKWERN